MPNHFQPNEPNFPVTPSIESLLAVHLGPATAPAALWDRIVTPGIAQARNGTPGVSLGRVRSHWLIPALAATAAALLIATALTPRAPRTEWETSIASNDPATIRAWVRQTTGADVPLRSDLPAQIELVSATRLGPRDANTAEIRFRADGRDRTLRVRPAAAVPAEPHNTGTNAWQIRGAAYELSGELGGEASTAASSSAKDTACLLCHAAL